jgi:succinate dehydrogenase / fumarate reductase cytochrome b subunit
MIRSSIGKKALTALTGLLLLGFVIAHLLGNLLIFSGPEAINAYSLTLRKLGAGLWAARIALLLAALLHIFTSALLTIENRKARTQPYRIYRPEQTNLAARSMIFSGILIALYIVYHLLHFTFRVTNPELANLVDARGSQDVYSMIVLSFQQWPVSLAYLIGLGAVCVHLSHGIGSSAQSLGLANERTIMQCMLIGRVIAVILFAGYASIPLAVLLGALRPQ